MTLVSAHESRNTFVIQREAKELHVVVLVQ